MIVGFPRVFIVDFNNRINGVGLDLTMEGNLASTVDICPDNRIGRSSSFGRVSHVFFSMAAAAIAMEKEGRRL